jgi:hypothetical protein
VLSFQSGKVGFSCSFASLCLFGLLNGLGSKELLLLLFGLKFLSGFFLLEKLEFFSSLFGENFFILSF